VVGGFSLLALLWFVEFGGAFSRSGLGAAFVENPCSGVHNRGFSFVGGGDKLGLFHVVTPSQGFHVAVSPSQKTGANLTRWAVAAAVASAAVALSLHRGIPCTITLNFPSLRLK
jgi:hypothetical protein